MPVRKTRPVGKEEALAGLLISESEKKLTKSQGESLAAILTGMARRMTKRLANGYDPYGPANAPGSVSDITIKDRAYIKDLLDKNGIHCEIQYSDSTLGAALWLILPSGRRNNAFRPGWGI